MVQRFLEDTDDGPIIHMGPSDGNDMTLCGYALEGEAATERGDKEPREVKRGKINCPACVNIILKCKAVSSRSYEASAADRYDN